MWREQNTYIYLINQNHWYIHDYIMYIVYINNVYYV